MRIRLRNPLRRRPWGGGAIAPHFQIRSQKRPWSSKATGCRNREYSRAPSILTTSEITIDGPPRRALCYFNTPPTMVGLTAVRVPVHHRPRVGGRVPEGYVTHPQLSSFLPASDARSVVKIGNSSCSWAITCDSRHQYCRRTARVYVFFFPRKPSDGQYRL